MAGGLDFGKPTFVSWLGVSMYLTESVVLETLRVLATLPAGSEVVFDYVAPRSSFNLLHRLLRRRQMARLAKAGEPWLSAFTPAAIAGHLSRLGFSAVDDRSGTELNREYFADRTDRLLVSSHSHVLAASR